MTFTSKPTYQIGPRMAKPYSAPPVADTRTFPGGYRPLRSTYDSFVQRKVLVFDSVWLLGRHF